MDMLAIILAYFQNVALLMMVMMMMMMMMMMMCTDQNRLQIL
jgi:hypothetical protein